jgi:hypothetical protein
MPTRDSLWRTIKEKGLDHHFMGVPYNHITKMEMENVLSKYGDESKDMPESEPLSKQNYSILSDILSATNEIERNIMLKEVKQLDPEIINVILDKARKIYLTNPNRDTIPYVIHNIREIRKWLEMSKPPISTTVITSKDLKGNLPYEKSALKLNLYKRR